MHRIALPDLYRKLSTRRAIRILPITLLMAACATPLPPVATRPIERTKQPVVTPPTVTTAEEEALNSLVALQDRLYRIAAPLLVNNPELCKSNARNLLGFTAKNKHSYSAEFTYAAQKLFDMDERLKVMGVLAGSGAARAGIRRGDDLIAIEDKIMPQGPNAERQAASILAPLVTSRDNIKLSVIRNGSTLMMEVPLTYACAFGIELGNTDNVTAYGDGYRILITRGMMNAVRSDEELAYVMAKEMAHNALSHANKQKMSATIGGIIDNLTRFHPDMSTMVGLAGVKPMPQNLDVAADKLSLYMLARAGYNIDNAIPFWQRMASQYPATMMSTYTALHPATSYRITAMGKTINDIKAKRAERKPLLP